MSQLKVYWPEDDVEVATPVATTFPVNQHPDILSFEDWAKWLRNDSQYEVVQRARRIHQNSKCPACSTARIAVFGNASQLAFECGHCNHHWSA